MFYEPRSPFAAGCLGASTVHDVFAPLHRQNLILPRTPLFSPPSSILSSPFFLLSPIPSSSSPPSLPSSFILAPSTRGSARPDPIAQVRPPVPCMIAPDPTQPPEIGSTPPDPTQPPELWFARTDPDPSGSTRSLARRSSPARKDKESPQRGTIEDEEGWDRGLEIYMLSGARAGKIL